MNSQATSIYSGLTLQMVRETVEEMVLTGSTSYLHPLDYTRNCVFCSDGSRSVIEGLLGVDHTPRGSFALGAQGHYVIDSTEVSEPPFEFEPSTSTNRHVRMACNINSDEPEDFEEEMMLDASTIPFFDSCGCGPENSLNPTHLSGQPLEGYDEDQPFDISSCPSFIAFETTNNVDPFSDSYVSPFSIPRSMIDWKRDIDASTIPAFVEFTVTNSVYPDYQFNPSIGSKGVGKSRQEAEPGKDHSVSDYETESSEWTSTVGSNSDYPGCESSDSGSGDEKTMDIKGNLKVVRNTACKLFLSKKMRHKVVPLPKAAWKFPSRSTEVDGIKGEEADVDEPGPSSQNQSNNKQRRLSSIEALVSRLPNTTLKIHPAMVVYDSKVDRPGMARSRLSLKRPSSDEQCDEFVERVKLMKGSD